MTASDSIETDVVIVGAGPVGLMLGNMLGAQNRRVVILERLPALIDYPRGVGLDDESLRAFQSVGLADAILPHTTPNHWMYFLTRTGRRFLAIEPRTDEFGWPRRNAFIQPLADAVLAGGLARFAGASLRFATTFESCRSDADGVSVEATDAAAGRVRIRARYLVGCDGGASGVRKALGVPFEGRTHPNRWLVVDLRNDPIGSPGVRFHCVRPRPHVSIALPHGIRRLEFQLFDGEAPGEVVAPELLASLLAGMLPNPGNAETIRARVYTHNGRLARHFRRDRVLLAGDAAHIMPVWQGQGYNSGIRDAFNLGWKLGLVLRGLAGDSLLDSYELERREHARAMIAMSEAAGKIFAPKNRLTIELRDAFTFVLGALPAVKRYFAEMRYKPPPRYREGALHYARGFTPHSAVGRMFIQPRVSVAAGGGAVRLDELIGPGFALLGWGTNSNRHLSPDARAVLDRLEVRRFMAVPTTQLLHAAAMEREVTVVGDAHGLLKDWFDARDESVVLLRPDRIVAIACQPGELEDHVMSFAGILGLTSHSQTQEAYA